MLEIKFKNRKYLLIGNLKKGGAIANEKAYKKGLVSYAHLFPNGKIYRFQKLLGTRDDIKILGEKKVKVKPSAFARALWELGWAILHIDRRKKCLRKK